MLELTQCMRSHGVPNFPEPITPGSRPPLGKSFLGNGPNPASSPTYQAASRACRKYAVASPVTPRVAAEVEVGQLRYARCMRAHGVIGFPDPSPDRGFSIPPSIDQNSLSYRAAEHACRRFFPGPPGVAGN